VILFQVADLEIITIDGFSRAQQTFSGPCAKLGLQWFVDLPSTHFHCFTHDRTFSDHFILETAGDLEMSASLWAPAASVD
jgi:hypothetical protein